MNTIQVKFPISKENISKYNVPCLCVDERDTKIVRRKAKSGTCRCDILSYYDDRPSNHGVYSSGS